MENEEIKQCMILLKNYGNLLNKQQYKTFRGQILSGDIEGFRKGLFNLIKRKFMNA